MTIAVENGREAFEGQLQIAVAGRCLGRRHENRVEQRGIKKNHDDNEQGREQDTRRLLGPHHSDLPTIWRRKARVSTVKYQMISISTITATVIVDIAAASG